MSSTRPQRDLLFVRLRLDLNGAGVNELADTLNLVDRTVRDFQFEEVKRFLDNVELPEEQRALFLKDVDYQIYKQRVPVTQIVDAYKGSLLLDIIVQDVTRLVATGGMLVLGGFITDSIKQTETYQAWKTRMAHLLDQPMKVNSSSEERFRNTLTSLGLQAGAHAKEYALDKSLRPASLPIDAGTPANQLEPRYLGWLIDQGHLNRLQKILQTGASATGAVDGEPFLIKAVLQHKANILKLLLKHGADANQRDRAGRTALSHAAELNDVEAARALLRAGAIVDADDAVSRTPLFIAVQHSNLEVAKTLVAAGANPLAKAGVTETGRVAQTVIEKAKELSNPALIELLTRSRPK